MHKFQKPSDSEDNNKHLEEHKKKMFVLAPNQAETSSLVASNERGKK
jgi:hypothetical protein